MAARGRKLPAYPVRMLDNPWRGLPGAQTNSDALAADRKAAEAGDDNAEYNIGLMYEQGEGVPKDARQALEWYRKAVAHGSAQAMNNVAWQYATSSDPAVRNPAE